jgi:hypothetical protein
LIVSPVAAVGAGRDWPALLDNVASLPAIQPESIASLGGWLGLGTRDFALAQCGVCSRGGLPLPFVGQVVHHHAVSPGFFQDAGQDVIAGRDFTDSDSSGSGAVAIVSAEFARWSFQDGDAVGRKLRIGADDRWYLVVGIVEDPSVPGLGRNAANAPSVYVTTGQHPPDRGEIALRASGPIDIDGILKTIERSGFLALAPPQTATAYRGSSAAPLKWWARWMGIVGALCLVVAVQSTYALARAEAVARRREMAIRLSLGSSRARVAAEMLRKPALILATAAFWAIPFATGVSAAVSKVALGAPTVSIPLYLGLCALLGTAVVMGTLGPACAVALVPPGEALG